jgi:hypothetical protein
MTKDGIELAYSFLHQKWRVYQYSTDEQQKDAIEYAISSFAETMSPDLYEHISQGQDDYLMSHRRFATDLEEAVGRLETLMNT